jgi:hypothetical protein
MLHLVYILAFTIIASIAISNLIRSLISLSSDQRVYHDRQNSSQPNHSYRTNTGNLRKIHPELLDERGKVIEEPLLVMRSVSVEDARQKLDALYNSSPNKINEVEE